jgi:hypothetical protein
MNENAPNNIPGITQPFNGRKTGKKTRRKPLSPNRAMYEEDHPPLGVRIPRGAHMQVHLAAQQANMTLSEYVTSLIEKRRADIEQVKAASFKEGADSRQSEVDEAFNRGKAQGVVDDSDRIWNRGYRAGQNSSALYVWCKNSIFGCNQMVPIEKETQAAQIAINAVYQSRLLVCSTCQWNEIRDKLDETLKKPGPPFYPKSIW